MTSPESNSYYLLELGLESPGLLTSKIVYFFSEAVGVYWKGGPGNLKECYL